MYELIYFDNHALCETYGRDAFGEFGTILAKDSDLAIAEPDFQSEPQLPSAPSRNISPNKHALRRNDEIANFRRLSH